MSWGELPGQLERFAGVLRGDPDTKPTSEHIVTLLGKFKASWGSYRTLEARRVPIPLPRAQGLHPTGTELLNCFLSFRFVASSGNLPVSSEFQVEVEGVLEAGDSLIELQDHWRIDSEMDQSPTDLSILSGVGGGREPHPSFHFQRGGHAQDAFADQSGFVPGLHTVLGSGTWKCLMQYPGPRIAVLPFDPILAIDFCIAQNDGLLWGRLRNVPEYYSIIVRSQERLWKPFLEKLNEQRARRRWLGPLITV